MPKGEWIDEITLYGMFGPPWPGPDTVVGLVEQGKRVFYIAPNPLPWKRSQGLNPI